MPTMLEAAELIENCTVWTDEYYMLNVKGPNGNVVKFAFNGGMYDKEVFDFGQIGYYWLSELYSVDSHPQDARVIYVRFDDKLTDTFMYRCYGCNIRPVVLATQVEFPFRSLQIRASLTTILMAAN